MLSFRTMDIGSPPEFGEDGSYPPIKSDTIFIGQRDLDMSMSEWWSRVHPISFGSTRVRDMANTLTIVGPIFTLANYVRKKNLAIENMLQRSGVSNCTPLEVYDWSVHALYHCFWQREDPVTQLPPGSSSEVSLSLRVGVSEERAREIGMSLGRKGDPARAAIEFQVSGKRTARLSLAAEKGVLRKHHLSNTATNKYRRLAIWHLIQQITVIAAPNSDHNPKIVCQETEFIMSDATNVTFIDVAV
jgi:hypothetical protein